MLTYEEAVKLSETAKSLSMQEWLFLTEDFPGDYGTSDECMLEILDYWLDLWITHDALLRQAKVGVLEEMDFR